MSKLTGRGIFLAVVIAAVLLLFFRNRLPFGKDNSSFAKDSGREITRIEFSATGKKLTLEKKGEGWFVDGKTEARKSGIMFINRILKEMQIKSPVSGELFKTEITDKGIDPVRVRIYEGRKQLRSFLVYKTASNTYGNIMKRREGAKPFIVYVPGFDGDIGSAFTLNELFWQSYTVYNLLPSEIASVNFENLSDTSTSFRIASADHHYSLFAGDHRLSGWDTTLVSRYLSYFAWIPFEKWALEMDEKEKSRIAEAPPLFRITVLTSGGKESVLTLWEKRAEDGGSAGKDSDRLIGKLQNSREFFVMRYFDIDPLLKKRSYFYTE